MRVQKLHSSKPVNLFDLSFEYCLLIQFELGVVFIQAFLPFLFPGRVAVKFLLHFQYSVLLLFWFMHQAGMIHHTIIENIFITTLLQALWLEYEGLICYLVLIFC